MKFIKLIIIGVLCLVLSLPVGAATVSSECDISDIAVPISSTVEIVAIGETLDIKAKSAILLEPFTGEILYEMNADEVLPPA